LVKGCQCCCYDPRRISQAKDVPEAVILHALSKRPGEWHVQDGDGSIMPSITAEAPELAAFPPKVLRRKLGAMARRGIINGCECGCRGDWHVYLGKDSECACGCGSRRKR
jgi:hypothetical protein